ncbi:D-tyrosyl-tRNA deacylase family protein [Cryptosporidium serpentis]
MKVVIQKVSKASVLVDNEIISCIGPGIVVLLGIGIKDTLGDADYYIKKCLNIRLWPDLEDNQKMWKYSIIDKNYEILLVSQFTLYGNIKKGSKPDFHNAMNGKDALIIFNKIVDKFKEIYSQDKIKIGSFGSHMELQLVNDGPVTICLDEKSQK